jgi:hypothetical protein
MTKSENVQLTKVNYLILKALMTGKYLQASVSLQARDDLLDVVGRGTKSIDVTLRKVEELGLIAGYVPILSEKGKKLMDALAILYEETPTTDGEKGSVSELLQRL